VAKRKITKRTSGKRVTQGSLLTSHERSKIKRILVSATCCPAGRLHGLVDPSSRMEAIDPSVLHSTCNMHHDVGASEWQCLPRGNGCCDARRPPCPAGFSSAAATLPYQPSGAKYGD
jgi:hypothetical protein